MHVSRAQVLRTFWEGNIVAQERSRIYVPARIENDIYKDLPHRPAVAMRSLIRCDTSERLTCREHVLAYGKPEFVQQGEEIDAVVEPAPVLPKIWDWERSYAVADNGWLRFGPCRKPRAKDGTGADAFDVVPCFAPGEPRLP